MKFNNVWWLVCFILTASCSENKKENAVTSSQLFHLLDAAETKVDFENDVSDGESFNILTYRNFYNGGGVAIGDINNDSLPDIYFTANQKKNKLYLNKGNFVFEDITDKAGVGGTMQWSTGVTMADVNNDGQDDALISINDFDCSLGYAGQSPQTVENKLISIDFANKRVGTIVQAKGFKNVFSTPWIGDLDNDGYLDIIYCQYFHHSDLLLFLGMIVKRIDTPVKIRKKVLWGSFLGSNYDGIFAPKN